MNIPSCTKGLEGSFRKASKKRFRGKYRAVEKETTERKMFRSSKGNNTSLTKNGNANKELITLEFQERLERSQQRMLKLNLIEEKDEVVHWETLPL